MKRPFPLAACALLFAVICLIALKSDPRLFGEQQTAPREFADFLSAGQVVLIMREDKPNGYRLWILTEEQAARRAEGRAERIRQIEQWTVRREELTARLQKEGDVQSELVRELNEVHHRLLQPPYPPVLIKVATELGLGAGTIDSTPQYRMVETGRDHVRLRREGEAEPLAPPERVIPLRVIIEISGTLDKQPQ